MNIRPAVPADAMAVARVHVRAWQVAYRGLMPDEYLQGLRPEDWAQRYDFASLDRTRPRTLIAVEADTILAFATISPARDDDAAGRGELCALYVDPDSWGRGIGQALVSAARDDLYRQGYGQAILWVVAGNARAERFYRADRWTPDGLHRPRRVWSITVDTARYSRDLIGPVAKEEAPPRGAIRRNLPIPLDYDAVAAFCRARGIRKLSLFGSVIRDDFDPRSSDIDVLAEFAPGVHPGLKFFAYADELGAILGRKVDFNTPAWLSKHFRDQVLREAVMVYEQA